MSRASELTEVKKCIEKNYVDGGIFSTRNIAGDTLETIFNGNYFTVDICKHYGYFEVFGTTQKEFINLYHFYTKLNKKTKGGRTMKNEKKYTTQEIAEAFKETMMEILENNIKSNEGIKDGMTRTIVNMKESLLISELCTSFFKKMNIDEKNN